MKKINFFIIFLVLFSIPQFSFCQETLSQQTVTSTQGNISQSVSPSEGTASAPEASQTETAPEPLQTLSQQELEKLLEEQKKESSSESEKISEDVMEDTFLVEKKVPYYPQLKIFGHNLFTDKSKIDEKDSQKPDMSKLGITKPDARAGDFPPILSIPVSEDYIIGPGDSIKVLMWGRLDQSFELIVDNEGILNFPQIGPLNVAGLKFKELKELIRIKAEAITGVNVSVAMGTLKTIQVFVLGEVKKPGLYTVSSLSTLINTLFTSGGPTNLGSLRNIQLKRNGEIITIVDLYDFLLDGDISSDVRLMSGDVVFIPQAGPMVSVFGEVRRPAIYEMKNMTLYQAIELAGGFGPKAFNQRIQIERAFENQFQIIQDISYAEFQNKPNILLQDGDLIRIFEMLPSAANAVYLYGNILRPGPYAYKPGLKIKDIIPDTDSLKIDTHFDYALIKRYRFKNMKTELIPFDLGRLLNKNDGKQNIRLKPLDEIYIFNKNKFEDHAYAICKGAVRKPGKYYIDHMRVRDLILKAGNLSRDAFTGNTHLYRKDKKTKKIKIYTFNLEKALAGDSKHNLLLQDLDKIIVHSIKEYQKEYTVTANGAINNPGDYPFAINMTIKDLILVAGNIKDITYLNEAELIRYKILDGKEVKTSIQKFNVSLALENHPEHNLKLQPMDIITLKQVPDWIDRKMNVKITGEVAFPGTYPIRENERISDVLERAGGYTPYAYYQGAFFTRESARKIQQKRLDEMMQELELDVARLSSEDTQASLTEEDAKIQQQYTASQKVLLSKLKKAQASGRVVTKLLPINELKYSNLDIVLENGDTLYIPRRPATINVLGAVYNPAAMIFDTNNPELEYYLARTGGPTEYAKSDDIYVIRVDGTVTSSSEDSWWWKDFKTTKLNPGDTILVPEQVVRPNYMRDTKDIMEIIYQLAVTAGITITQVF